MADEGRKKKTNARKIGRRGIKRKAPGSCKNKRPAGVLRLRGKAPRVNVVSDGAVWFEEAVINRP